MFTTHSIRLRSALFWFAPAFARHTTDCALYLQHLQFCTYCAASCLPGPSTRFWTSTTSTRSLRYRDNCGANAHHTGARARNNMPLPATYSLPPHSTAPHSTGIHFFTLLTYQHNMIQWFTTRQHLLCVPFHRNTGGRAASNAKRRFWCASLHRSLLRNSRAAGQLPPLPYHRAYNSRARTTTTRLTPCRARYVNTVAFP